MHRILKNSCIVIVMILSIMTAGCQKEEETVFQEISEEDLEIKGDSSDDEEAAEETIFVHICGEVVNPGVYEFVAGSRVYEAVEAAGGMSGRAASDSLNQAELLTDGQQIYVPSEEEIQSQISESGIMADKRININKASKEELMTLSGVGEAKADAIIRYRSEKGSFKSIEEIMEIEGIKEGVFRKIEDRITVS